MEKISVTVLGVAGRMGKLVAEEIAASADLQLAAGVKRGDDARAAMQKARVVVDFTHLPASAEHAKIAADLKIPIVIGTSGMDTEPMRKIEQSAQHTAIFYARNFSVGLFIFQQLVSQAARQLPPAYQAEITETHHAAKKDAPSGTALILAESIAAARGLDTDALCFGRQGDVGARPPHQIGIHALRMGSVIGEHSVYFAAPGETIELSHRVLDRRLFAIGALQAARFLIGKKPGLYGMADMLGDSRSPFAELRGT